MEHSRKKGSPTSQESDVQDRDPQWGPGQESDVSSSPAVCPAWLAWAQRSQPPSVLVLPPATLKGCYQRGPTGRRNAGDAGMPGRRDAEDTEM